MTSHNTNRVLIEHGDGDGINKNDGNGHLYDDTSGSAGKLSEHDLLDQNPA